MKQIPAILILSVPLWAQDGTALLKQSATAFAGYTSYEMTQVTTTEPASMSMTMHFQVKSGKHRMEMSMFGTGFTMLSDGKNSWMIAPAMKRYMKLPTDATAMNDFADLGHKNWRLANIKSILQQYLSRKLIGFELDLFHEAVIQEGPGDVKPLLSAKSAQFAAPISENTRVKLV